jgi:putative NADPH-quinone reductase/1,4-dihydroxy-2-naphthoate octaprenyltransferase
MGSQKMHNPKNILIVYCHPSELSLNHGIKASFISGLHRYRTNIRVQDLYSEHFDPILYNIHSNNKDNIVHQMQANITWADWLVFIYPLWWGGLPAMLKGYFDRVFTENFAFRYNQAGIPEGLLEQKKAFMMVTCDTPPVVLRLSRRTGSLKSVIRGILNLCGIKHARYRLIGSVLTSTYEKRKKWITMAEKLGEKIGKPDTPLQIFIKQLTSFIKAVRLPLYSFVFCTVLLGAAVGVTITGTFKWPGFIMAVLMSLSAHIAVSFSNEVMDEPIDRINMNRTMFNGGTGLLSKELITKSILNTGWIVFTALPVVVSGLLVLRFDYHWLLIASFGVGLLLGLEYNFPPFRFSRIGLGEAAAFVAYGVPVMLVGLILQVEKSVVNNLISNYRFYLIALPVSLSVFATLCLTQIPDTDADRKMGKKSISVLIRPRNVLILSVFALFLCVSLIICFTVMNILSLPYTVLASLMPLLTGITILNNLDAYKKPAGMTMIHIMGMSVTSSILCALIPAIFYLLNYSRVSII